MYASGTSYHVPVRGQTQSEPQDRTQLGKDSFLKLLVAQLANQDPTNPQDSQAFAAQLAQFSTLEQLTNMSTQLDNLLLTAAATNQASVLQFAGKDVVYTGKKVYLEAGEPVRITADFPEAAGQVSVTVKDENGKVVRTMQLPPHAAGKHTIEWDGLDDQGNPLPSGTYTVEVAAATSDGKAIDVEQYIRAHVEGVSYEKGYAELLIGDLRITLADVTEIHES